MCTQSGGLIARAIEQRGIPTTLVTVFKARALPVKPPRALFARFERGQTFGPPGDATTQSAVLRAALELLQAPAGPAYREFAQPA